MKQHGLTLLELVIAIAMVALVASLALPSFGSAAERGRLKLVAETLASDLAEARFEAAQRGQVVFLDYRAGAADWCWAVATAPGCACGSAQPCQLKAVRAADHGGIRLVEAESSAFDMTGKAAAPGGALLQSARGDRLRVKLSAMGRASICLAAGAVPGYAAC